MSPWLEPTARDTKPTADPKKTQEPRSFTSATIRHQLHGGLPGQPASPCSNFAPFGEPHPVHESHPALAP